MERLLIICLLFFPLFGFFSCDDFLDENPDNRVTLDNLDKAAQLLVSAYSISSPNFTDWMTDDVDFTVGTEKRISHDEIYQWKDVTTGPTESDTPDFYWFQTYEAIAHSNEVLAILDGLPLESEEDTARKRAIESEALLTRAYGHFMLVNMFARHYSSVSSGLGVPYVTAPETAFLPEGYRRISVQRVYDAVEEDMLRGLELADNSFFENSGKYHFNRNAALAFACRFYLYKRDYVRCVQYADELLGSSPANFVRDLNSSSFQMASSSVIEYPRLYTSPDLAANLMLMRKESLVQRLDFAYGIDGDSYRQLFGTSPFGGLEDERQDPAFVKGLDAVYPARYPSLFLRSSLNSNVGTPYYIHIAFSGEEVLLNRAEANAWLNNLDDAIADLQILSEKRFSRGTPLLTRQVLRDFYLRDDDDGLNVLNYIIFLERRKEFLMQGLRWYDIKRYGLPVVHNLIDGSRIRLDADDDRKAFQIPKSAINVGGLEPNPR